MVILHHLLSVCSESVHWQVTDSKQLTVHVPGSVVVCIHHTLLLVVLVNNEEEITLPYTCMETITVL